MAKKIKVQIRLLLPGGAATPATKAGPALGQHKVNIMEFCKQFNARTADRKGQVVPVNIVVYEDLSFEFEAKTPPASELIKKKANVTKGASKPHEQKVGKISWKDAEEIARIKMADLNAHSIEAARTMIAGSARSMGIDVVD
ncbi:50S ribosomal protein L11 [bacterium]|nr:MAG: 50S ribosomal protein L11 [bacterium]QQR61513.1 MAG: 50S ribosomal protein L11 [bacterium]QQR62959.1 MAG: 50S ribosomal protein L11 [bacterium]